MSENTSRPAISGKKNTNFPHTSIIRLQIVSYEVKPTGEIGSQINKPTIVMNSVDALTKDELELKLEKLIKNIQEAIKNV